MNIMKKILVGIGALLLGYILLIVAIPALVMLVSSVAIFGNIALYVIGIIAIVWIIVKIINALRD